MSFLERWWLSCCSVINKTMVVYTRYMLKKRPDVICSICMVYLKMWNVVQCNGMPLFFLIINLFDCHGLATNLLRKIKESRNQFSPKRQLIRCLDFDNPAKIRRTPLLLETFKASVPSFWINRNLQLFNSSLQFFFYKTQYISLSR